MSRRLFAVFFLCLPAPLAAAETLDDLRKPEAAEARLRKDIFYLASPQLEGRGVTTKGIDLAAEHIVTAFKAAGLKPAGPDGSYFQPFGIAGAAIQKPPRLVLYGPQGQQVVLQAGVHFEALGLSHPGRLVSAPVVFVGYGIASTDPSLDEWDGVDVDGKVVVVLRDTPRADNKEAVNGNWKRLHGSFTQKMKHAEARRAAAVLFVNDRDTAAEGDDLLSFGYTAPFPSPHKLPALHVRRAVASRLLGTPLDPVERDIERELKPQSRAVSGWTVSLEVDVQRGTTAISAKNVVGTLEGAGKLADETIVIGAHYDHVGYGGRDSLAPSKKMAIHYGADDNASGTTSLLELARRFAAAPKPADRRRLVFIAFSGEELGLFGSQYYCNKPLFPLTSTAVMINLDMVGRAKKDENNKEGLTVQGTGTGTGFDALIDSLNKKYAFRLKKEPGGAGPSDHMSFYLKKVPVFFFFTDLHTDYHRPSDTPDKINFSAMRRVVEMTEELAAHMATVPEKPEYKAVAGSMRPVGGPAGVRLGIMPSYADAEAGVRVESVTNPTGPAAKAGIKEGDRIVEFAGKVVKDATHYTELLKTVKPGDTIEVVIVRAGKRETLKVKLE